MKTIFVIVNGITTKVVNNNRFELFNWENFEEGDPVYVDGAYFANFTRYEKSEVYDEIVVLKARTI